MALFDRSGRKKHPEARRLPGNPGSPANRRFVGMGNAWWEVAEEFPSEALYDPAEDMASAFDPTGSYTGIPEDGGEPVQDADDL